MRRRRRGEGGVRRGGGKEEEEGRGEETTTTTTTSTTRETTKGRRRRQTQTPESQNGHRLPLRSTQRHRDISARRVRRRRQRPQDILWRGRPERFPVRVCRSQRTCAGGGQLEQPRDPPQQGPSAQHP